ncbi:MAG: MBL fold metallo-hydrolase [Opitutaceae bacterium]|nr:MBL fold metallo-hydrolase [Opitutaceae bacterium]
MKLRILASGSSGNCALLQTEQARVLIDAGYSARRIRALLAEAGERLEAIDAVFVTHDHSDHTLGLSGLARLPELKVFANAATMRAVQATLDRQPRWQIFETGSRFRFLDLEVDTFSVPHDAHDPVGFRFSTGFADDLFHPRKSLAWLTDLGHVPQHVRERLNDCDSLVVESNHCPALLKACVTRPWSTKQRISGRHGHLSNESVLELLSGFTRPRWRHVFLTHLSRDCNSLDAVEAMLSSLRTRLTCDFNVVAPGGGTSTVEW